MKWNEKDSREFLHIDFNDDNDYKFLHIIRNNFFLDLFYYF